MTFKRRFSLFMGKTWLHLHMFKHQIFLMLLTLPTLLTLWLCPRDTGVLQLKLYILADVPRHKGVSEVLLSGHFFMHSELPCLLGRHWHFWSGFFHNFLTYCEKCQVKISRNLFPSKTNRTPVMLFRNYQNFFSHSYWNNYCWKSKMD